MKRMIRTAGTAVLWFCFTALLLCSPVTAQPFDGISILVSSDALPYRKAADTLEAALGKEKLHSRILFSEALNGMSSDSLQRKYPAKLWVAIGSRAASQLNTLLPVSMPLVYCMVAGPEKIGLNAEREVVAGVSVTKPVGEQFAIVQTAMPDLDAIGMLYRSSSMQSMQILAEAKKQLPAGWRLEAVDVDAEGSVAAAIQEVFERDIDMVWTGADSAVFNRATVKSLLLTSLRNGIPVFGFSGSFVKAGALLGFVADPLLQGEYASALVVRCLGLHTPSSCLLSSGVTLSINMVVANRLGITLPANLLSQADVIRDF